MLNVFTFSTNFGVRSVNETPRGAYDAARKYIDEQNDAARKRNPGGEPADEFFGKFVRLDGFQDKPAEAIAHELDYFIRDGQKVIALYFVYHIDKIMKREEIAGVVSFARVQE